MKGPLEFVAVLAGVLLLSAVLAPALHDVLPYPFARIFKRLLMIGAILGVVIFVRFRKDMFTRFGMAWTPDTVRFLWTGFVTGLATLIVFAVVSVVARNAGVALRQLTAFQWVQKIAAGLLTGILIGILEEFLFRGFVYSYTRDTIFRGHAVPGMIATSLLYASLHFLNVRTPVISPDPGIADSLKLILAPVQSLADWPTMWPAAIGLFLFGMILNSCVVRTGSLYPSIGLHAGCVTFLRVVGLFLRFGQTNVLLWSTKNVYDGAMGWAFLLLIGVLLTTLLKRAEPAA
ncbi:MAG: CPBP family intramembrane metalloprotease [Acidobacteria bacterium]|nr:CPBP family intramembrane metalloprotease [Acidobacteriota bacterium]